MADPAPSPMRGTERAPAPRPVGPSAWALPDPTTADATGVVGVGADLAPATLVDAYRRGIFPWPHEGLPLPWFSPDPRGTIPLEGVRVSRSLRQRLRRCGWDTTVDDAFSDVVRACTLARRDDGGTWITPEMAQAYLELHRLGWAHSVEVWNGDELIGGLYGVQLGGCFTGESMFHQRTDASKVALVDLVSRLTEAGATLLDVQLTTEHLATLGAVDMPRRDFLGLLARCRDDDVRLVVERLPVSRLTA